MYSEWIHIETIYRSSTTVIRKSVHTHFLLYIFKISLKNFVCSLFCSSNNSIYNNLTVFFQILFNRSRRAVGVEFIYRGKVSWTNLTKVLTNFHTMIIISIFVCVDKKIVKNHLFRVYIAEAQGGGEQGNYTLRRSVQLPETFDALRSGTWRPSQRAGGKCMM